MYSINSTTAAVGPTALIFPFYWTDAAITAAAMGIIDVDGYYGIVTDTTVHLF
jgi:hypothetical protein